MSEERVHLHTLVMPVRWSDMDAVGHVNNAAYFVYLEQTRVSWLDSLNATETLSPDACGPVIVTAHCSFHKPIVYPATIEIQMFGGPAGRCSFDSFYEIRDGQDRERIYTTGSAKVVWVNHKSKKSAPLPGTVRRLLPRRNA